MTAYPDLDPLPCLGEQSAHLIVAVGWLGLNVPYDDFLVPGDGPFFACPDTNTAQYKRRFLESDSQTVMRILKDRID